MREQLEAKWVAMTTRVDALEQRLDARDDEHRVLRAEMERLGALVHRVPEPERERPDQSPRLRASRTTLTLPGVLYTNIIRNAYGLPHTVNLNGVKLMKDGKLIGLIRRLRAEGFLLHADQHWRGPKGEEISSRYVSRFKMNLGKFAAEIWHGERVYLHREEGQVGRGL